MLLMLPLPRAPEPLPTTTPGFSDPIHPKLFAIVIYVFIYYYTGDDTKKRSIQCPKLQYKTMTPIKVFVSLLV